MVSVLGLSSRSWLGFHAGAPGSRGSDKGSGGCTGAPGASKGAGGGAPGRLARRRARAEVHRGAWRVEGRGRRCTGASGASKGAGGGAWTG
jgi:hypothetical protein